MRQMALAYESPVTQSIPVMDSGQKRLSSALARGVQITELSDGCMNPQPIIMQESDILMEQYLSPTKLQLLTGSDNLDQVRSLELKVDTTETSLNNFGSLLPNLTVLKLSGSIIPCIRDLGSALRHLEVLLMPRCALQELDGISSMLKLRELYLAYNELSDLSPLSMLDELEILDLEGNNIDDLGQLQYLTLCPKLHHVTLDGNPICVMSAPDSTEVNYDYRQAVKKILPNLLNLDDRSLTETESAGSQNVFDADWAFLEELQQDALLLESAVDETEAATAAGRPTTAALRPATAYRPGSALRPSSGYRPMSASRRPSSMSDGRPSSAWTEGAKRRPASSDAIDGIEAISDLTCGTVICGNPSKALRERRKAHSSQESLEKTEKENQASKLKKETERRKEEEEGEEKNGDDGPIEDKDLSKLLSELHSWKTEHEKRLAKIRESKAPQVFKIEHSDSGHSFWSDDGLHLSGDDESDDADNDEENEDVDNDDSDSVMHQYHSNQSKFKTRDTGSTQLHDLTKADNSQEDEIFSIGKFQDGDIAAASSDAQSQALNSFQVRECEKSLDTDQELFVEYKRLKELEKQYPRSQTANIAPFNVVDKREMHTPSTGLRPLNLTRPGSPKPFSLPGESASSPSSLESPLSPNKERARKLRIGPTGLPASGQQPQIRDIITPPGKQGPSGVNVLPGQRLMTSGLQQRIRRQLPQVPALPSRPPLSKS